MSSSIDHGAALFRSPRVWRVGGLTASLAMLGTVAGCNILGPAGYLVSDDRTPAAHRLDPKRTAVVFVDDRNSVLPTRALRQRIAAAAEKEILGAKLLDADVISSESLQQVVMAERFSRPRSIAEVGRAVQADQVIYAAVDSFTLSPDGSQHAPSAKLRVKVIDAKNDARLFPPDDSTSGAGGKDPAFTVSIEERVRATPLPRSTAEVMKEQQEVADELGKRLGSIFFKHHTQELDKHFRK